MKPVTYRVKSNLLYFVRFEDTEVVMVLDDAPGALDAATVFTNRLNAKFIAEIIGGELETIREQE